MSVLYTGKFLFLYYYLCSIIIYVPIIKKGSSFSYLLCGSSKYPCPPNGKSMEIPMGEGGLKAFFSFKKSTQAKLEFPEGWDSIWKTFHGWGKDIFETLHIVQ